MTIDDLRTLIDSPDMAYIVLYNKVKYEVFLISKERRPFKAKSTVHSSPTQAHISHLYVSVLPARVCYSIAYNLQQKTGHKVAFLTSETNKNKEK